LAQLSTRDEFMAELRRTGTERYHHVHPFHRAMNAGQLTPEQIRLWIANRFYYQQMIPIKDAAILSACPLREVRRIWLQRIVDHDGQAAGQGGIEAWLRLGEAAGLSQAEMWDQRRLLPGVRFAVDAYLQLVRSSVWQVAVASSLTEWFAPDLMRERLAAFERYYPWIAPWGLEYFRSRITQARQDSDQAVQLTLAYCDTAELQRGAVAALATKCDILWTMLDAIQWQAAAGPSLAHASIGQAVNANSSQE
jgi:pyrroloquinoline-quinone synthase